MAQARIFSSDPALQPSVSESIAKLLKEKFSLYGEVHFTPLTNGGGNRVVFLIPDQGQEENTPKSRGERASEFVEAICAAGTVAIGTSPTEIHPDYFPHSKNIHISVEASQLEKVKKALELMCAPAPQGHAMFARC